MSRLRKQRQIPRWAFWAFFIACTGTAIAGYWDYVVADPLQALNTVATVVGYCAMFRLAADIIERPVFYLNACFPPTQTFTEAAEAERTAVLSMAPPVAKAMLLVVRDSDVDSQSGLAVRLNGQERSLLPGPGFTAFSFEPGVHVFEIELNGYRTTHDGPASLEITARTGEIIIYRAAVTMDWMKCYVALERLDVTPEIHRMLEPLPMMAA